MHKRSVLFSSSGTFAIVCGYDPTKPITSKLMSDSGLSTAFWKKTTCEACLYYGKNRPRLSLRLFWLREQHLEEQRLKRKTLKGN